ncbi:MAG: choice-of-anchor F family protein [Henriciella sp.]|uniref:choice-of-anchor F family protein n=1 Tax=Henriciella sp. TaxID=1968823 RepID=UPI0032EFF07E
MDPEEGVVEPGLQIVTTAPNNDDYRSGNGFSAQSPANCIMASNGYSCDAPPKLGNRAKLILTGRDAFDVVFSGQPSGGITEYFTRARIQNETGARMTGYRVVLGQGQGGAFQMMGASGETGVQFDNLVVNETTQTLGWGGSTSTTSQDPLQRTFYAAGLFGDEEKTLIDGSVSRTIGFFSADERVALLFNPSNAAGEIQDELVAENGVNFDPATGLPTTTVWSDNFGASTAIVDFNVLPEGLFWDNDGDPDTDAVLMAAYLDGQWVTYRELDNGDFSTGVDADGTPIAFTDGTRKVLTQDQIDSFLDTGIYGLDVVEDIAKVNTNFSLDIGDYAGEFTLRIVPTFAPIVENADTLYRFEIARRIDYGRVPYLGYDGVFAEAAAAIETLPEGEMAAGIERLGFGYLGAFDQMSHSLVRLQADSVFTHASRARAGEAPVASDDTMTHSYTEDFSLFLTAAGGFGEFETEQESVGAEYDSWGLTLGADYRVNDNFLVGGALSYAKADGDINDQRGSLDLDSLASEVFVSTSLKGGYADALLGISSLDATSDRLVSLPGFSDRLNGVSEGESVFGLIKAGWDFDISEELSVGPMLRVDYSDVEFDGFTETGSGLAMEIDDHSANRSMESLGGRAVWETEPEAGLFRSDLQLAYVFPDEGDDREYVTTRFTGGADAFKTPIHKLDHGGTLLEAGLEFMGKEGKLTARLDYAGLLADQVDEHQMSASIRLQF